MRVLIEYKGKRVDIKCPITMRDRYHEDAASLKKMIDDVLVAVGGKA